MAAERVTFRLLSRDDRGCSEYAIEVAKGRHGHRTIGRVMGRGQWAALAVGADCWTEWHSTRAGAVTAMREGRTWHAVQRAKALAASLAACA